MKRILLVVSLFISVGIYAQTDVVPKKPSLAVGLVLDQTNTLTPEQQAALRQKLIAYDQKTSNQIAVIIIPSLKGNSIEDVGLQIGREWGVGGQAEQDNGVLILVAKGERKIRIEVGYGLEGAVTDNVASSIIQNTIQPNFKEGNYYRGFTEAIDEIIKAAEGRYTAPKGYGKDKGSKIWKILLAMVFIWIVLAVIGRGGRGGGGFASRRGYRNWGGPVWWGGGSGWSGGSGGGWSGGGSGGFGGFGGGSFGGGGASGSW